MAINLKEEIKLRAEVNVVRAYWLPLYSSVQQSMRILEGIPKENVISMMHAIWNQVGTPQDPVDWSEPDLWIPERLKDENSALAYRIWNNSNYKINPRHFGEIYRFINNYELLVPDSKGIYHLSDRGNAFLANDTAIIQEIDELEGLLKALSLLVTKNQAKISDLLPEWGEFLRERSRNTKESAFRDTLRGRLYNLVDRGLAKRNGQVFFITSLGVEYAASRDADPKHSVLRAITSYNDKQKRNLREYLGQMNPYLFEHLIGDLLDEMGYSDVKITKPSSDKGVDVVATVEFGITTITEVVQVKRHKSSIGREVLDQLRGVLPLHKALRGTLITLGNFSKGCREVAVYPGAAPITLIDGDKLIDLLFKYKVGIREHSTTIYEIDEDYFTSSSDSEQESNDTEDRSI